MVVMCALHLAIFLEICGAVAFLHSLLMSAIVVSDKFADVILVFCLHGDSLRLLTCVAVQRLPVRLLGRFPDSTRRGYCGNGDTTIYFKMH